MKPRRTLWGSWAWKPFCGPCFLFVGNRLQPPWPSLSSNRQIQTVADQGREGMQRQGRNIQETIVQPSGRVLVPPQGIHITISLSSSAELNPQQMEDVSILHSREEVRLKEPEKLIKRPLETSLKEHRPCTHPDPYQQPCPWTIAIKLLPKSTSHPPASPKLGHTVLRARARSVPLCLGKPSSCSFLLHPKLCLWDLIRHQFTEAEFSASGRGAFLSGWLTSPGLALNKPGTEFLWTLLTFSRGVAEWFCPQCVRDTRNFLWPSTSGAN